MRKQYLRSNEKALADRAWFDLASGPYLTSQNPQLFLCMLGLLHIPYFIG